MRTRKILNRASICEQLEARQLYSITAYPTDGSSASVQTQRSEAREIIVTLDTSDTLTTSDLTIKLANGDGSGANDGSSSTDISSTVLGTPTHVSGDEWSVPFVGSTTYTNSNSMPSLKNGIYNLAVTDGSDTATVGFWRLEGDLNGDGVVNSADSTLFNAAITTYTAAADFNYDGAVNASDNLEFYHHDSGTSFSFPTMTSASASTYTVTGMTVDLTANGGASSSYSSGSLVYHWSLISGPSGVAAPTYSANDDNAAASSTATLYGAGTYVFGALLADPATNGIPSQPVWSPSTITAVQTPTTLLLSGGTGYMTSVGAGQAFTDVITLDDQFADLISTPSGTSATIDWAAIDGTSPYTGNFSSVYTTVPASTGITSSNTWHAPGSLGTINLNGTITYAGYTVSSNTQTITVVPPSVATVAAATLSDTVKGSAPYVTLNTLGADPAGESTLTYTWTVTVESTYGAFDVAIEPSAVYYETTPVAYITGSVGMDTGPYNNGLNSAKSIYATMNTCGRWTFTCTITDAGGNTATTAVDVNVAQKLTTVNLPSEYPSTGTLDSIFGPSYSLDLDVLNYVGAGNTFGPYSGMTSLPTFADQFGEPLYSLPTGSLAPAWSLDIAATGALSTSGPFEVYTSPAFSASGDYDYVTLSVIDGYGNSISDTVQIELA